MTTRILRFPTVAVVLGLTAGLLPPTLTALQSAVAVPKRFTIGRTGMPASDSELTAAVQARLAQGDVLTGLQRYAAAEREYREAAKIVRRQGCLPSLTLWRLANVYYFQGNPRRAAMVLEQLAVEAAQFGDLPVQALALFNAAWLNGEAGRSGTAARKLADLSRLLRSSYLPDDVRDYLNTRLSSPSSVATER